MGRKLPVGIQDFARIREEGFVYVDKTARIYQLASEAAGPVFLSRPRRFGKSLLCSTLGALFEGRQELFDGIAGRPPLAVNSLEWTWKQHPVIRLDLNPGDYAVGRERLDARLHGVLSETARYAGLPLRGEVAAEQFYGIIRDLAEQAGQKAVVIIDEYDKPLLSTIDKPVLYEEMRNALKSFYGVLKSSDAYLQFVFLTGVTKFSQASVFSELNNLTDISMNPKFCDICGITQEELERDFADEIAATIDQKGISRQSYLERVKHFYNGYRFSEKPETVYNPFGLLNHFNEQGKFNAWWFATATPNFLVKLIENQKIDILNLENKTLTSMSFQKFNVDNMDAVAVLYQSGYLTIVDYSEEFNQYTLDYPNEEVRASFADALLEQYVKAPQEDINSLALILPGAFARGDIEAVMQALPPFFASIPYDIQLKDEKYYQTIVHLIFRMLGLQCRSEVRIAAGRIDTLVETAEYVYCFEFKLHGTAEDALEQMDRKDYLLPWTGSGKRLFKIGVSFDYEKRNIHEWKAVTSESL
jgi:PAS domain-containing protein